MVCCGIVFYFHVAGGIFWHIFDLFCHFFGLFFHFFCLYCHFFGLFCHFLAYFVTFLAYFVTSFHLFCQFLAYFVTFLAEVVEKFFPRYGIVSNFWQYIHPCIEVCKFLVRLLSFQQGILVELSIRNVIGERYSSVITEKRHTTNENACWVVNNNHSASQLLSVCALFIDQ